MWFTTTTQPPVAGIFSPSIQSRFVAASNVGLTMTTTVVHAQPRFCCSSRDLRHRRLLISCPACRTRAYCHRLPEDATAAMRRPSCAASRPLRRIVAMSHTFALLVPVKTLALAKSRLAVAGDLTVSR